jgi:hypothetical protein
MIFQCITLQHVGCGTADNVLHTISAHQVDEQSGHNLLRQGIRQIHRYSHTRSGREIERVVATANGKFDNHGVAGLGVRVELVGVIVGTAIQQIVAAAPRECRYQPGHRGCPARSRPRARCPACCLSVCFSLPPRTFSMESARSVEGQLRYDLAEVFHLKD